MKYENIILYEALTCLYLIGYDNAERNYQIIEIDRTIINPTKLYDIIDINNIKTFNKQQYITYINSIKESTQSKEDFIKLSTGYGLIGFVKFLDYYYIHIITQRKLVGNINNHDIYTIKSTEIYPIRPKDTTDDTTTSNTNSSSIHNILIKTWKHINKRFHQTPEEIAESRYLGLYSFIDMSRDFYYSYTYDLSYSLQINNTSKPSTNQPHHHKTPPSSTFSSSHSNTSSSSSNSKESQDMFVWNHYQINDFRSLFSTTTSTTTSPSTNQHPLTSSPSSSSPSPATGAAAGTGAAWCIPIIHGYYQQKQFSLYSRLLSLILLTRRSRHYAGTRYLKRGINIHGQVANDCEIEQIIQCDYSIYNMKCISYIQYRGSIPTYWSQETSVTMPKPPILLSRRDPAYTATKLHFNDLYKRYNQPMIVLDLGQNYDLFVCICVTDVYDWQYTMLHIFMLNMYMHIY